MLKKSIFFFFLFGSSLFASETQSPLVKKFETEDFISYSRNFIYRWGTKIHHAKRYLKGPRANKIEADISLLPFGKNYIGEEMVVDEPALFYSLEKLYNEQQKKKQFEQEQQAKPK